MSHRQWAVVTILAAVIIDTLGAWAFSVTDHKDALLSAYWAVYTATTTGYGDVPVTTTGAHLVAMAVMCTAIPLWSATFTLFTSGLVAGHVSRAEHRIKKHVEEKLESL